jgi:hypothetical protein
MVTLAISSLERMKQDDSRRISSLAERLLAEFDQAHRPGKIPVSIPVKETEPVAAVSSSEDASASLRVGEAEAAERTPTPPFTVEKIRPPSSTRDSIFEGSFWPKWIGCTVLAIVLSLILYNYDHSTGVSTYPSFLIWFAGLTGVSSLAQQFVFRNQLTLRWIVANTVMGAGLGWLQFYLFDNSGWGKEHLGILLAVWLIVNFALGPVLMNKRQEKSKNFSSLSSIRPTAEWNRIDTRQNLFFIFLSTSLVLFALLVFSAGLGLTSAAGIFKVLHGIANILIGISFFLNKEVPRNFGFIALALFSLLFGLMIQLDYFASSIQQSWFSLPALLSLLAGVFFASQKETRQDFAFLMLAGYLLSLSAAQITIDSSVIDGIFSLISSLFGLAAAFFFFRDK